MKVEKQCQPIELHITSWSDEAPNRKSHQEEIGSLVDIPTILWARREAKRIAKEGKGK